MFELADLSLSLSLFSNPLFVKLPLQAFLHVLKLICILHIHLSISSKLLLVEVLLMEAALLVALRTIAVVLLAIAVLLVLVVVRIVAVLLLLLTIARHAVMVVVAVRLTILVLLLMVVLLSAIAILLLLLLAVAILLLLLAVTILLVSLLTVAVLLLLAIAVLLLLLLTVAVLLVSLLLLTVAVLLLLAIAVLQLLTVAILLLLTIAVLLLLLAIAILLLLLLTVAVQLTWILVVLVALVAIILHSLITILILSVLLLGHIAHELVTVVGLIGGPSGFTVRHHTVATNVTILDTFLHIVVVLGELNEGILLVLFVRHGRNWMRVWDVMTTEVIATVHGVLHVLWKMRFSSIFIQWFPDWTCSTFIVIHLQFLERGPHSIHGLSHGFASAVGSNNEVFLHFGTDNGPLRGAHWSLMTTKIVINEELAAVATCLTLGEEGIRKEYR